MIKVHKKILILGVLAIAVGLLIFADFKIFILEETALSAGLWTRIETQINQLFNRVINLYNKIIKKEIRCQDECWKEGIKQCLENDYQICGDYNADGCLEWGPITVCQEGMICEDGECIPIPKESSSASEGEICNQVIYNGDPANKLDIVFVSDGYAVEDFDIFLSHVQSHIETFLSIEPFKSKSNKLNFYYTSQLSNNHCENVYSGRPNTCTDDEILPLAMQCPAYDQIVVLTKVSGDHGVSAGSFVISSGESPLVTVHELGHSFGGLSDEYYTEKPISDTSKPNCDVFGCPKWCSGSPLDVGNIDECSSATTYEECSSAITHEGKPCMWSFVPEPHCEISVGTVDPPNIGTNCKSGFGCYNNCHGINGYRSALHPGIMGTFQFEEEPYFSPAALEHLANNSPWPGEICKPVILNGSPEDKLDIVFVPINFKNMDEFSNSIIEHIDVDAEFKGILYYEPFKSNSHKFNFYKSISLLPAKEQEFIGSNCQYPDSEYIPRCAQDIKNWLSANNCVYDKAIILYNNLPPNTGGGWAESFNGVIALTVAREYPPFVNQGHMKTVHEFAHLLGLSDEKVWSRIYIGDLQDVPNCDFTGCPKWCQDYTKTPTGNIYNLCKDLSENDCKDNVNCFWRNTIDEFYKTKCVPVDDHVNIGLDCLEGTGCYYNCNGVGAWRPADYIEPGHRPTSIMFYTMDALGFDAVDRRHLEKALNKYK